MVSFRFEEADLEMVIRALADVARINVVLAPGVKAKVTLWIERVPATEAFVILEAILEVNNLVAIKSGLVYKIVPAASAAQQPTPIGIGKEDALAPEEGFLTQIIPIQNLTAEELVKVLQPLVAPGRIVAYREINSLILSGPASMIKRLLRSIQTLDVPGQQREAQQLYVYYVENVKATELAATLTGVFGEKRIERGTQLPLPEGPRLPGVLPPPQPPRPGVAVPPPPEAMPALEAPPAPGEARLVGEVRIVADAGMNALIIKATPADYRVIERAIKMMDLTQKQVVIEVLAAEITLTDSFSFGLEWFLRTGGFAVQQFFGVGPTSIIRGAALSSTGFTMTFVDQDRFRLFLNTLSGITKINTLATPHILTQNNREAKIQVGQEVPIVTGTQATVSSISGGGENVFQTIAQRDIGRILAIRPHVNEKRQVSLDVQLEVTDTLPSTTVSGTPSFSKRSAQTSVVVEDGQSLLIGGIISTSSQEQRTGLPWLSRIPILGWLFSQTTQTADRTELFIMLTPHVVANPEEGRALTDEFRKRLDWVEEQIRKARPVSRQQPIANP
ncbi:MAG TPA: secretin N-terminal domain-containing protein [Candidatus Methylomirabilis sp.]|nr:secretin N-terminal domain-containing protein [Candidatus Methylomirabilis sp.]HSC70432.1 secretin N-terminal domain-containing protein [Candidatus Methylomirabilis sp.]